MSDGIMRQLIVTNKRNGGRDYKFIISDVLHLSCQSMGEIWIHEHDYEAYGDIPLRPLEATYAVIGLIKIMHALGWLTDDRRAQIAAALAESDSDA